MPETAGPTAQPGSPSNPLPLPRDRKTLARYYRGERLRSPMGGFLEVLGVKEVEGGGGRVLLECSTSSLRYVLEIPKASRAERAQVKAALEGGRDPVCPRHGPQQRLVRSGKLWVCPLCGVPFASQR